MDTLSTPQRLAGRAFTEAEPLFHQDNKWLGTDGANSTPLSDGRIFWTFEDTFIALTDANIRPEATMVRNTIAIQTGNDPLTAKMDFYWGSAADGSPASFFPEDGNAWYWTGGTILLKEGPLISFLYRIIEVPGVGLGFRNDGFAIAVIQNSQLSPKDWSTKIINGPRSSFDAIPATAIVRDGEYIIGLAIKQEGQHSGALVRYRSSDLASGNLLEPEWWAGEGPGWVAEEDLGNTGPEFVISDAGAESSVHWDEHSESYVHIATYGFGDATIGIRTAPALTGPWSEPIVVYEPPENDYAKPFVYGAIAHPELKGPEPDDLVVTYATNAWEWEKLVNDGNEPVYWPRVIAVKVRDSE